MKLRKLICILGLGTVLMLAAACGGKKTSQDQQTQDSTVVQEDTEEQENENTDAAAEENASQEDSAEEAASSVPARIYGTITEVGEDTITVDNQSDVSSSGEIILTIDPENTILVDAQTGLPMTLADIEKGSFEAYLGPAMTMSLPPQTTPYVVVANIPEDGTAPQYAVAAGDLVQEDGFYTLEATDGRTYTIPEDVEISPFRTRNIVTLADLTAGRAALIWLDENETAVKIVLLEGVPGENASQAAGTEEENAGAAETDAQTEPLQE